MAAFVLSVIVNEYPVGQVGEIEQIDLRHTCMLK